MEWFEFNVTAPQKSDHRHSIWQNAGPVHSMPGFDWNSNSLGLSGPNSEFRIKVSTAPSCCAGCERGGEHTDECIHKWHFSRSWPRADIRWVLLLWCHWNRKETEDAKSTTFCVWLAVQIDGNLAADVCFVCWFFPVCLKLVGARWLDSQIK